MADWKKLADHVQSIPEQVYETWNAQGGWDNVTPFGVEFGENGVPWCVIFNWDMYHDVGLDGIVPKVDNVGLFTEWAKAHGQWSEYPSIGAWVNFGGGAHTEIVVGFDSGSVYTKGGNSIQAGATDNGQGNGVWSHSHARTDPYVVGYFAPRYPDGICPPTADPADPRGGAAVASYTWAPDAPAPTPPPVFTPDPNPFPGASFFGPGQSNTYVTRLGQMLCQRGGARFYATGPGPTWGTADQSATRAFQEAQGWTGADADGIPGQETWNLLVTRTGHDIPAPAAYVPFPGTAFFTPGRKSPIIAAMHARLVAVGCNEYQSSTGLDVWGSGDQASYAAWQRKCGYTGSAADGIPGPTTWTRLQVPAS